MKIAICDDNIIDANRVKDLAIKILSLKKITIDYYIFSSGENFLSSPEKFDIVFMDIYMENLTGMDTVKNAPSDKFKTIVFTTTSNEFAVEAFSCNAVHYLIKPVSEEGVTQAINRCLERLETLHSDIIEIKTKKGIVPINLSLVMYIEVVNKVLNIYTAKEVYTITSSLETFMTHLNSKNFLKVQRSFVVNMYYIASFNSSCVVLENGVEISISRNNKNELKKEYQDFIFRIARED